MGRFCRSQRWRRRCAPSARNARRPSAPTVRLDAPSRCGRAIEWEEALDIIEHTFKKIKAEHGPDALAFIASSKCSNEESFVMQKLSRAVIGTNNVDNCA